MEKDTITPKEKLAQFDHSIHELRLHQLKMAKAHLAKARRCCASAPKTLERVRLAESSVKGALRHELLAPSRATRQ